MAGSKVTPTVLLLQRILRELEGHRGILESHRGILESHGGIFAEHGSLLREHGSKLDAIERRQTETEVRLSTELVAVAGAIHEVRDLLRDSLDDRNRVQDHELRIQALERQVG